MPDLNWQKLILVEVLIPTMVDKTVAISIRGNLFFNYIFSYEIFNKLYQRNAVK